jgi:hypothetical protein
MGRPRKEINQDQLESICRAYLSLKDVAAFFQCSEDTIENRCKEWGYEGFSDCRSQNMVHTRLNIQQKAIAMASEGNVPMLIFTLKNLCNWVDKQESTVDLSKIQINIDKQDENL